MAQYSTWADAVAELTGAKPASRGEDATGALGLNPWEDLDEQGALNQINYLLNTWHQHVERLQSAGKLTAEEQAYLESTPWNEMPNEWKALVASYSESDTQLHQIESALQQAEQHYPDLMRPSTPMASDPASPLNLGTDGTSGMSPEELNAFYSQLYQEHLTSAQLGNQMTGLNIQAMQDAMQKASGPLAQAQEMLGFQDYLRARRDAKSDRDEQQAWNAFTRPMDQAATMLGFKDMLTGRKDAKEDRERAIQWAEEDRQAAIEARQRALQQQAWQNAFAQRQLGASIAQNIGGMEQDAWRFTAQNALPAGIGHVPGFGPDSRLAQIMGPSFGGLPTITLDTPDPRGPYAWALNYARGG